MPSTAICPSCLSHQTVAAGHAEGAGSVGFCLSSPRICSGVQGGFPTATSPHLQMATNSRQLRARGQARRCSASQVLFCSRLGRSGKRGTAAGFNPPCHSPGGFPTLLLRQRESRAARQPAACTRAMPHLHRFGGGLSPAWQSWHFPAPDPALPPPPSSSHPEHPAHGPTGGLQSSLAQVLRFQSKRVLRAGCLTREKASSQPQKVISQTAGTTNTHFWSRAKRGCLGVVPAEEQAIALLCYL